MGTSLKSFYFGLSESKAGIFIILFTIFKNLLYQTTTVSHSSLFQAKCIVSLRKLMEWV